MISIPASVRFPTVSTTLVIGNRQAVGSREESSPLLFDERLRNIRDSAPQRESPNSESEPPSVPRRRLLQSRERVPDGDFASNAPTVQWLLQRVPDAMPTQNHLLEDIHPEFGWLIDVNDSRIEKSESGADAGAIPPRNTPAPDFQAPTAGKYTPPIPTSDGPYGEVEGHAATLETSIEPCVDGIEMRPRPLLAPNPETAFTKIEAFPFVTTASTQREGTPFSQNAPERDDSLFSGGQRGRASGALQAQLSSSSAPFQIPAPQPRASPVLIRELTRMRELVDPNLTQAALSDDQKSALIELEDAVLGRIKLEVSMASGGVALRFWAERDDVGGLLRGERSGIEQELANRDLALGHYDVGNFDQFDHHKDRTAWHDVQRADEREAIRNEPQLPLAPIRSLGEGLVDLIA